MGLSCALGEVVVLGIVKEFPPDFIAGYSSGTGFAGVVGAGLPLVLRALGLGETVIFLLAVPSALVYHCAAKTLLQNMPGVTSPTPKAES
jgi:hypothetical protein